MQEDDRHDEIDRKLIKMPPGPKVTYDNSHATNSVSHTLTKNNLAKRLNGSDSKTIEPENP
jgi:hypothetical protein